MLAPIFTAFALILPGHAFKAKKASDAELVSCLADQPDEIKVDCMSWIAKRGVSEAGEPLAKMAIEDPSGSLRGRAIGALERLEAPQVTDVAIRMAREDAEPKNRSKALVIIQKLVDETHGAPVVLERMAADPDPMVRRKALTVAKKVSWAGMEQGMIDHGLTDEDSMVRRDAIYGLLAIESRAARPAIYAVTRGLPAKERTSALRVWGKNPLPEDKDFLIEMLDADVEDVAIYAARALAALGDATVAPLLRDKSRSASGKPAVEFERAAQTLEGGG